MDKEMLGFLGEADSDVDKILRKSSRAICGAFEKEVIVKDSEVWETKAKLKKAGYIIIGTGEAGAGRKKVWFNPAGVNL